MKTKSIVDYRLFIEAWIYLSIAKLMVQLFPFKKIASKLGTPQQDSSKQTATSSMVDQIELSIVRAVKYVFFTSKCYDQALAVTLMLKRRRVSSTIYFGVYKELNQLIAHAWVKCGDKIVAGKKGYEKFTPVAWFGS